jgi:hypothetical protein
MAVRVPVAQATPGLTDVRRWSAAGLEAVVMRLDVAGRVLAQVGGTLARARPPDSWRGRAADAARTGHEGAVRVLQRLVAEAASVRAGLAAAVDAVIGLHAGLAGAQELADRHGFTIAADGTVADGAGTAGGAGGAVGAGAGAAVLRAVADAAVSDGARSVVRAEIVDRVEQVRRAAGALDAELAALLTAVAAAEPVRSSGASLAIGVAAPPDGTVADSAGWWSALAPAARRRVVAEHPEWIGNRDGIAAVARDEANRRLLGEQAARLAIELRAVQARYDALTATGPGQLEAAWLAARDDLLRRIAELRRRQEVVDAVGAAAAGADRRLLLLDLEREHPRAAVAAGDVDTADHVAVLAPGFGTAVGDDLSGVTDTAEAVSGRSVALLPDGASVATVAWLGYDAPGGVLGVSTPDAARRGGADLARFYDGIDASRRVDPHLTALGHSYGSLTTGYALRQAHGVDDAVLFGSPGIGTGDVGDLRVPAGHTGVVEAPWDPVADLGWFGADPNRLDGVTGLSARAATLPDGTASAGSVLHSQYLTPGTTSEHNVAATVAGLPEQRVLDPGVGFGDGLRDAFGGLTRPMIVGRGT